MVQGKQPFSSVLVGWNLIRELPSIMKRYFLLTKLLSLLQNPTYDHLTVGEFYTFYSKLLGISPAKEYVFDIDKNMIIKNLSTGMRKKVYYNALLQKPYILYIFDEPFNGLDVISALHIKQLLYTLAQTHIVFVASHLLETLRNCERIYLLQGGTFQAFESHEIAVIEELLRKSQ